MIHLDTSVLIDALSGAAASGPRLRAWIDRGERLAVSSIVLYEWLRGPRLREQLLAQEALFPTSAAVPFGAAEAALAATLHRTVKRAGGREVELAIAACALAHGAALWTLHPEDFRDVPDLKLV